MYRPRPRPRPVFFDVKADIKTKTTIFVPKPSSSSFGDSLEDSIPDIASSAELLASAT